MCGNSLLEELIVGDESIKLFDERLLDGKFAGNIKPSNRNEETEKQIKEKERELQKIKSFDAKLTGESIRRAKEIEKDIKALKKNILVKLSGDKYTQDDFYKQKGHYFDELRTLHKQYFTEYDPMRKKEKREQIEAIELKFIKSSIKEKVNEFDSRISNLNMQNPEDRKKQAALMKKKLEYSAIPEQIRNSKTRPYFLWKLNFFEVFQEKGGFDVVIANPPYVNIVNLSENLRDTYKNIFYVTKNKVDLYAYFIEKDLGLLKKGAVLSFIIPQTWKATISFSKLREIIFKKHILYEIVDLDFGVFDAVVKPVIIFVLNQMAIGYKVVVKNQNLEVVNKIHIQEVLSNNQCEIDTQSSNEFKSVFRSIERDAIPLSQIIRFSRGIKTSNDKKFITSKIGKIDNEYHKVFRGKNIKAYTITWGNEYIWYRPDLMRKKEGCLPHSTNFFEAPEKIVTQRVNSSMQLLAAYDNQKRYFLDTVNVSDYEAWRKDIPMKFICALLNSAAINFYYCNKYRMPTIGGYELHSIPIKLGVREAREKIICLFDKIIGLDSENKKKKRELMLRIDQIVYDLYGLTKKEIEIIENSF